MTDYGSFQLTSVADLPTAVVAFPGEHWSDGVAVGTVRAGAAVIPVASGARIGLREPIAADVTGSGAANGQVAIALNPVQVPDGNAGSIYNDALGPNDIVNRDITNGNYVHRYLSGVFHLTLIEAQAYTPGALIGWKVAGTPQTGQSGTGAWTLNASSDIKGVFEVVEFRTLPGETTKGVLTVRSLRSQF